jgi:hypothetical protein
LHLPSFGMLPIPLYTDFVQGIEDWEIIDSKRVDKTPISYLVFSFFFFFSCYCFHYGFIVEEFTPLKIFVSYNPSLFNVLKYLQKK